jgi:RNA polymerase sigma factor (sigma-70 family)
VTDEVLMLAVRDGDLAKLGLLFERYHLALYDFLSRMTGDRTAAEDLVQDVFVRILKYRATYREEGRFETWLFRIARNARADYFRKQRMEEPLADEHLETPTAGPPYPFEREREMMRLKRALMTLREDKRELIVLARYCDMKHEQIDRHGQGTDPPRRQGTARNLSSVISQESSMRCEDVNGHLADHLTGRLPPPRRRELQQHLDACQACRDEADGLEELWHALEHVAPERTESPAMRARFAAMLEGYGHGFEGARTSRGSEGASAAIARWWPGRPAVQAALSAALLVIGILVGRQSETPAPPARGEIAALRQELHDMHEMVTLSLMQQQSASERLRGVGWSNQLDQPGGEIVAALLDTLMHDPNMNVRLATVDALQRFAGQPAVRRGAVEALDRATSPLVQIALIDFVVELNERESIATLRRLSQDSTLNDAVRGRAAWGLQQVG